MKVLKWIGIGVASLIVLLVIAAASVYAIGGSKAKKTYDVTAQPVTVPTDSASIARGRHLVRAVGKCVDCHGEDLGGTMFIDGMPFARVAASNLTRGRGGVGSRYTDLDYVRAIRHGVLPDGRGAIIMPAEAYRWFSDQDLGAIIAYIRSVPAVDREWSAPAIGPIGRALITFDIAPIFPAATFDQSRADVGTPPAADTTPEYGRYLANAGGCTACHGAAMSGREPFAGSPPGTPRSANLTPYVTNDWTEADFIRVLREGKGIGGRDIDNKVMPWRLAGEMTDAEIHAIWLWLRSLPPKQFGES